VKENPDIFVIDLSRAPSQGRDLGILIRQRKSLRHKPIIYADGDIDKLIKIKKILPDAFFVNWSEITKCIENSLNNSPNNPIVPGSVMVSYKGKTLIEKLNIKPNTKLLLLDPPYNYPETFPDLFEKHNFGVDISEYHDLTIWFVRNKESLFENIEIYKQEIPIWIAWPKKSSPVSSDLNQTIVRNTCLKKGLVDYKICSLDSIWSALLFTLSKKAKKNE